MAERGWHPDPGGRYDLRWFDGTQWTEHVVRAGVPAIDPVPGQGPTPLPELAPPLVPAPTVREPRPPRQRNGLALAALIVGAIGVVVGLVPIFFFVSGPLGLTAIVLGVVGITSGVRRTGTGRGMAIAGMATGAVAMVLAIAGVIAVGFLIERTVEVIEEATGPADPTTFDLDQLDCRALPAGTVSYTGAITNLDDRTRNFLVDVDFRAPGSGERLDRGSTVVPDVDPGERVRFEVVANPPGRPELVECTGIEVSNFFS